MEILERDGSMRLIKRNEKFVIQERKWFSWRDVCFGPFGRYPIGITEFNYESIARILYYTK